MNKEVDLSLIKKMCPKETYCLYRASKNTVYKLFESANNPDGFEKEKIEYLTSLSSFDGFDVPISILYDNGFICGYEQKYYNDCITISDYLKKNNSSISQKKCVVKKGFQTLKRIHNYYILADIHNGNILTDGKNMYFVDLEAGTPVNIYYPVCTKYSINDSLTLLQSDAIKLFISSLCFTYENDYEDLFKNKSCMDIYEYIVSHKFSTDEKQYISDFVYEVMTGSRKTLYFDEYININESFREKVRQRFIRR